MKTRNAIIAVLAVLVLWLGYLQLSRPKQVTAEPAKEMWHTNTVVQWRTNTLAATCYTNTVELWRTNTVTEYVTKEVVKNVPAQLSADAREAAIIGYKYLKAPAPGNGSEALYRANPVAVEVVVNACDKSVIADDPGVIKKNVQAALQSRNIPVAESSPYRLSLTVTPAWKNDVPRVALLAFKLDLREKVALQREGDLIRSESIVWSTTGTRFVRTINLEEELKTGIQEQLDKFCADYLKAKEAEKDIKARIPSVPGDLLPAA